MLEVNDIDIFLTSGARDLSDQPELQAVPPPEIGEAGKAACAANEGTNSADGDERHILQAELSV
jgi:hypothetical protein